MPRAKLDVHTVHEDSQVGDGTSCAFHLVWSQPLQLESTNRENTPDTGYSHRESNDFTDV